MELRLNRINQLSLDNDLIYLTKKSQEFDLVDISESEKKYIFQQIDNEKELIIINQYSRKIYIQLIDKEKDLPQRLEQMRNAAFTIHQQLKENKTETVELAESGGHTEELMAFIEGILLSDYSFIKYFTKDKDKKKSALQDINFFSEEIDNEEVKAMKNLVTGVYHARNLVNEPASYLSAPKLAEEIEKISADSGLTVEVFDKKKIESLKMGGILAVNKGSIDPPTFTVVEWKPENAQNEQPFVFVGKGVVFDTGGINIKPTMQSLEIMKSDMAGAAVVTGLMYAVAQNQLPLHVIGLIPATDNRVQGNAYVPGDIVTMHNGMTVEIKHTDAEGRMLLADALSYAQKYKPQLLVDIATLTGSAAHAIGKQAMVIMGNAGEEYFEQIEQCSRQTYERVARFPFWNEYKEYLKSDIADITNIGIPNEAGAITAGKFLEHFADKSPFIHFDIAGVAFAKSTEKYRGTGATGTGIRLLYEFLTTQH